MRALFISALSRAPTKYKRTKWWDLCLKAESQLGGKEWLLTSDIRFDPLIFRLSISILHYELLWLICVEFQCVDYAIKEVILVNNMPHFITNWRKQQWTHTDVLYLFNPCNSNNSVIERKVDNLESTKMCVFIYWQEDIVVSYLKLSVSQFKVWCWDVSLNGYTPSLHWAITYKVHSMGIAIFSNYAENIDFKCYDLYSCYREQSTKLYCK